MKVGELVDALAAFPRDHYVMVIESQEDGDKVSSSVTAVTEIEGVVYLEDEPHT